VYSSLWETHVRAMEYGASPVIWDHTVLTCHQTQVNMPQLNPMQAGLDLPTPEGWKAELTLDG